MKEPEPTAPRERRFHFLEEKPIVSPGSIGHDLSKEKTWVLWAGLMLFGCISFFGMYFHLFGAIHKYYEVSWFPSELTRQPEVSTFWYLDVIGALMMFLLGWQYSRRFIKELFKRYTNDSEELNTAHVGD